MLIGDESREDYMLRSRVTMVAALVVLTAACGSGEEGDTASDSASNGTRVEEQGESDSSSGAVVNPASPGQATVTLEGEDYTLDTIGPVGCTIEGSAFEFSFLMGDNEINLVGGGDASASTFNFNLSFQEEGGITQYAADHLSGDSGTLTVDGSSMSYVGSMSELVEGGERESVGEVTISATCG
jgi:hypothetical protein